MSKKDLNGKSLKIEDGKVIIENEQAIQGLKDQGMQFKDDGSLDLDDGQNITISITIE